MDCPKCGEECCRDQVDVGVGIMYGPWGCMCGWSEYPEFDSSDGPSPAQKEAADTGRYVDSCGVSHSIDRIAENLSRFGIPRDLVDDVFEIKEQGETNEDS